MKNTSLVKTTALSITTTTRVFYPLLNIIQYYLQKMRSCCINWIQFISPMTTWNVFLPCSSTDSAEKYCKEWKCVWQCAESNIVLPKKKRNGQKTVYCKKEALERKVWTPFYKCFPKKTNQRRPVVQCLQKELKKPKRLNLKWN